LNSPLRSKVHRVAHPHRIGVVRARRRLRNLVDLVIGDVVDEDLGGLTAAVVLPLREGRRERIVGDAIAVRRVARARGMRHRQRLLDAAVDRDGEELRVALRVDGASRREEN
jgi:hypothetical protein